MHSKDLNADGMANSVDPFWSTLIWVHTVCLKTLDHYGIKSLIFWSMMKHPVTWAMSLMGLN